MPARMTLTQFMDALREEGVVGEEYEDRVQEFIERRKQAQGGPAAIVRHGQSGIERRPKPEEIPFPISAQDTGMRRTRTDIPVDETPAEAEERWLMEEAMDPHGVLSAGGMTSGGIFGSGPIATDGYDPGARQRAVPVVNARVQIKQLEVLDRLDRRLAESEQENRELRAEQDQNKLGGRKVRRRLGGKRR
jgi:hypothetical protein